MSSVPSYSSDSPTGLPQGSSPWMAQPGVQTDTEVIEKLAPLYRVICHDDPHTTMQFVVEVLMKVFRLGLQRATEIMYEVDNSGAAVVGRYPKSMAERRVNRAKTLARADGFPLSFSIEKDV